jgi:hypothetical protein
MTNDSGQLEPTEEWSALFRGQLEEPDKQRVLRRSLQALADFVAATPTAFDDVTDMIRTHTAGPARTDTWDALDRSLTLYLGREPANLFSWIAESIEPRMEELDELGVEPAMHFLRRLFSLYASELEMTWTAWREFPDDWMRFSRDVFWDALSSQWNVRLRLIRYDGEESEVRTTARGFLNLINYTLRTLRAIPTPDAFPEDMKNEFYVELGETMRYFDLLPDDEEEGTPAGEGDEAAPAAPPVAAEATGP